VLVADIKVPCTYEDAMNCSDSNVWLEACTEELSVLRETKMYIPVRESKADPHNVVGCRWVFAIKKNANGDIEHYKACIIAKGFNQIYAIDYDKTFTPVIKWSSIQILLTLAARSDLEVHQMDVKMAFLNGDLEHEIFMHPPPGCADYGWKDIIWKLRKSLYGLKQAS